MADAPVRFMLFPERPDCMLVFKESGAVALPTLRAPFVRSELVKALSAAGVDYRISEGLTGRWDASIAKASNEARADRRQRELLREAADAVAARHAGSLHARDRADAIQRKHRVDQQARELKTKISEAKTRAHDRGEYMHPRDFRAMEKRLEALKQESQVLQTTIGELGRKERAESHAAVTQANREFVRAFYHVTKRALTERGLEDLFDEIVSEAEQAFADGGDDDAREPIETLEVAGG